MIGGFSPQSLATLAARVQIFGVKLLEISHTQIKFLLLTNLNPLPGILAGAGGLELPQIAAQMAIAPSPRKAQELQNYLEVQCQAFACVFLFRSRVTDEV